MADTAADDADFILKKSFDEGEQNLQIRKKDLFLVILPTVQCFPHLKNYSPSLIAAKSKLIIMIFRAFGKVYQTVNEATFLQR